MLTAGIDLGVVPDELGRPVSKEQLEASPLVPPESRVLSVTPFVVKPANGLGFQIRFSDGSALLILPATPVVAEAGEEALPELADWELSSQVGLLSAGPGLTWSFTPSARSPADR